MDLDEAVINGGIFHIEAEDIGIDCSYGLTINGGSFYISSNGDGLEAYDYLTINDGVFEIYSNSLCIYSFGSIAINGGAFCLKSFEYEEIIVSEDGIILGEKVDDFEVLFYDYCSCVLYDDSKEVITSSDYENKNIIRDAWVSGSLVYVLNSKYPLTVSVRNDDGEDLVEGVDYTVSFALESIDAAGDYLITVTGIGDYVGTVVRPVKVTLETVCSEHVWEDATCTAPKICSACGTTEGDELGHTWVDATTEAPKTCSVCGATEGEKLPMTPDSSAVDHSECEGNWFAKVWNAIANFFRRLFGKPEKCICGEEM